MHRPRTETPATTTARLRPVSTEPAPALSWRAPTAPGGVPGGGRPATSTFGRPDTHSRLFARRTRAQVVAAAVCLVLGTGLIGGAVTGAWLADGPEGPGTRHAFAVAGDLWHEVPVDQLFPPTVQGRGAGPGEADRVWTRIAVAPDSGCEAAFDALLGRALAPVGCERLLRATYTDATQSHVTTVGLLFTEADAAGMEALARRFDRERLDRRSDLMPLPYGAKDTASWIGPEQRASWAISVLTDAPVVVYAVSGWADGRAVDEPQPAEDAMRSGATTAPAQAGLGHEARGLADRSERALRQQAGRPRSVRHEEAPRRARRPARRGPRAGPRDHRERRRHPRPAVGPRRPAHRSDRRPLGCGEPAARVPRGQQQPGQDVHLHHARRHELPAARGVRLPARQVQRRRRHPRPVRHPALLPARVRASGPRPLRSVTVANKNIPDSPFRDDDGSADPRLSAALAAWAEDGNAVGPVLEALKGARLLVPVVAVLGEVEEDDEEGREAPWKGGGGRREGGLRREDQRHGRTDPEGRRPAPRCPPSPPPTPSPVGTRRPAPSPYRCTRRSRPPRTRRRTRLSWTWRAPCRSS
ncbi:hypothetical protein STENM223S_00814 [Streptomyces tendae]